MGLNLPPLWGWVWGVQDSGNDIRLWGFDLGFVLSPNGATVLSPGREPWERKCLYNYGLHPRLKSAAPLGLGSYK